MVDLADAGALTLLLPTAAIADAQATVKLSMDAWHALLPSPGVRSLPLSEHCAVELGTWHGDMATRQVVHEAQALRAAVVTADPGQHRGHNVGLLVV